ncbi:DUF5698 domain-containing protein [Ruminococcaceae bacterium OttesenSCG-928-D13]|nr:DUF5698 domain-containing protein [Ruminococcaceae bacterium OttesenSCG-928-D13]
MNILIYVGIFLAKMIEVSLSTVRNVLINRGEKIRGAIIGFFEVLIWIIVVSNVLDSLSEDPLQAVIYCLAFACGNYLGVIIENKLAIGTACIQAMVTEDMKDELSDALRGRGFGVTIIQGQGMEQTVDVLMIYLKRKCLEEAIGLIREYCPTALITVNDVRQLRNGFIRK